MRRNYSGLFGQNTEVTRTRIQQELSVPANGSSRMKGSRIGAIVNLRNSFGSQRVLGAESLYYHGL